MTDTAEYSDVIFELFAYWDTVLSQKLQIREVLDFGGQILKQITVRLMQYIHIALILVKNRATLRWYPAPDSLPQAWATECYVHNENVTNGW